MSQEKVREILSHVDMTKIDLSSFQLSEKKFNEMATLYRNRLILTCVTMIAENDSGKDSAFGVLEKVADNPNIYDYATVYACEREAVDKAINDIVSYRNRSINDVKIKAIQKRIKATYKEMRKSIEGALNNGAQFVEEFNEATVNRCLEIAQNAISNGRQKSATVNIEEPVEPVVVQEKETASVNENSVIDIECKSEAAAEHPKREKVSFWKRIFVKA